MAKSKQKTHKANEYKEKLNKETEKLEEKRKTHIEELLNERNSNKEFEKEKYEEGLRKSRKH